MTTTTIKFQARKGTLADWTSYNPVLAPGEPAYETDTGIVRFGDGVSNYLDLPRFADFDDIAAAVAAVEADRVAIAADRAAVTAALAALQPDVMAPVGITSLFPSQVVPAGWLRLDGATLSRASYADLWAWVQASSLLAGSEAGKASNQFGPGNGTTTFSLIDSRGEFIRDADFGRGVDAGRVFGSFQDHQVQNHGHALTMNAVGNHNHTDSGHAHTPNGGGNFVVQGAGGPISGLQSGGSWGGTGINPIGVTSVAYANIQPAGAHTPTGTVGNPNSGNCGSETRPRSLAWQRCIKF